MATQEIINVGAVPNDGDGDPLRVAFQKVNNNFTNLFSTATFVSNTYSVGNTAGQVIWSTPANTMTTATFFVRSSDPGTNNSQTVTITSQLSANSNNVKFTAYGTTFFGNAITSYDMGVVGGNVLLKVNPETGNTLLHFISASVFFVGNNVPGLNIELDGYVPGSVMETENNLLITTEE